MKSAIWQCTVAIQAVLGRWPRSSLAALALVVLGLATWISSGDPPECVWVKEGPQGDAPQVLDQWRGPAVLDPDSQEVAYHEMDSIYVHPGPDRNRVTLACRPAFEYSWLDRVLLRLIGRIHPNARLVYEGTGRVSSVRGDRWVEGRRRRTE